MNRTLRIGTRGSKLALAQARWVQETLQRLNPELVIQLVVITTSGDRFVDRPLSEIGGKGLFVKEIEEAMLAGRIDCAVHSMKDLPGDLAPGLVIAATPRREDPRDLLLSAAGGGLARLRHGASIGTSSLRRMALLRSMRSDLDVRSLRGNVDTRLGKLDRGELDAIVLAAAGLRRLDIERPGSEPFDPEQFVPAVGQGVLALESRADATTQLLAALDDRSTSLAVAAERAFLQRVGGSCRTPLAAYATVDGEVIALRALIADPDGTRVLRGTRSGATRDAATLGADLADELLGRGGAEILRALDIEAEIRVAGKIYLVGAGPGDPGLLTLKGKRCLEQADIIIYDYLANPRLLDYARPGVEHVLVGKHGGGSSVDQATITRMIIEHARQGRTVVRLKGGDPFIFGRGAEEAAAAHAAGIDCEVVPGVSSAIAVPAYAGIPLTHRELASNVIFTTGYEYPTKSESAVHWSELARSGSTLVIMMTQRQLGANMEKLIDGGLDPGTPVAVIEWGTRAAQRTVVGTAATIAALADEQALKPPALAVVGAVVTLRSQLNWFERKPLFGRRIVITRPRAQAADFAERLEALGAEIIPFPTIETVAPESFAALDSAIRRAAEFDWVVFTSANGVRVFFERLQTLGADIRAFHRARVAAIGPQTARAVQAYCVRVDSVPDEYRAEAVVAALAAAGVANQRVLLPRAAGAREVLPVRLRALGAEVEEVVTYTSILPQIEATELRATLQRGEADLITFTSSSTVHNFIAALAGGIERTSAHTVIGCIGPVTAETARSYDLQVAIQPTTYTIPAFVDAIVRYYASASQSGAPELAATD